MNMLVTGTLPIFGYPESSQVILKFWSWSRKHFSVKVVGNGISTSPHLLGQPGLATIVSAATVANIITMICKTFPLKPMATYNFFEES
jgi:hypothetical protein